MSLSIFYQWSNLTTLNDDEKVIGMVLHAVIITDIAVGVVAYDNPNLKPVA